jgi:crotonobetainyl-CoA:carnitine CoA-transferase CaiB-like acyl-CoA transferase
VTARRPSGGGKATEHSLPLSDVRVIAVEQFGAGPWGTLQLSDLGAEVIKIEDPAADGDVGRYVPPFQVGEDSLFFETFNRNKKSISLDLRHDGAPAVLHDLVRVSDAVYSNLRGDQPAKLGLTYETLKEFNPRIVCCSLSGFGMTGPRAAEGGYDYMMQGLAGWQSLTGEPEGPPTKSGISLVDLSGGYASVIALLAGLWRARRDGVGCDCDVSLFETALHELMYIGPWAATHGYVPPRMASSAHPSIVPFQNFRAKDGWFVVAAAKQKFWERLCEVAGRPELSDDPRFATMAARNENRDVLLPILEELFLERTVAEWLDLLVPAGVPSAKINSVLEALEDEQTVARGGIVEHEHPSLGSVRTIASPLRLSGEGGEDLRAQPPARAPFRGEHTEEVLVEYCGYSPARVRELYDAGVFGKVALRAGA